MLQRSLFALPIVPAVPALSAGTGEFEHAVLCVRDAAGLRPAKPNEIMDAGRRAIDASIPRGAHLNHPDHVKEYFLAKLGGMQREVMGIAYPYRGYWAESAFILVTTGASLCALVGS